MTSSPDIAASIPRAVKYALERSARRETRADFERLAALGAPEVEALGDNLRRSIEPGERALAALLAGKLPAERALARLAEAVELEHEVRVLAAVAEALGELPGAASSQQLERLAQRDEVDVRRAVASALYKHDDATAFATLLVLARDPDLDTRGWAVWALADGFPPDEQRDEALRAYLRSSPESQLRTLVRGALESARRGIQASPSRKPTKRRRTQSATSLIVLVVSANPVGTTQLALDEEVREITAGVRATPGRDVVELRSAWAMRPGDLLRELNEHAPAVLHFSGHGTADGRLVFVNAAGSAQPVTGDAIAAAITSAGETVRVVVLNACFSAELAHALMRFVDIAVGMDRPIGDDAARVFAQAFYAALGYGSSVGRAFEQARAALMLEGIPEERTPQLVARDGVDPYELVLVDPAAVRRVDAHAQRRALEETATEHLAHLQRHSRLPIGEGLELTRRVRLLIAERASKGSLLVLGTPGSGKTGATYGFASDAIEAGSDVVVIAADLLDASGRRSLSEELGLELDVVDVLAAWSGDGPAYLVVDALDAARGREAAGVLLDLIERVAARAGRWRVVASVRTFDLRHNPSLQSAFPPRGDDPDPELLDPEFPHVRHVHVGPLSDQELADLAAHAPLVEQFLAAAQPPVRELARVPFNLRLLVVLLEQGEVDRSQLGSIGSQLELLDLYWGSRVLGHLAGRDARELFAQRLCEQALDGMRLQVPRARMRALAAESTALDELLREGVLVEVATTGPRGRESLGFSHHVLFDYAVHRLLLSGAPDEIADRLAASEELVLLARPSLVLTLAAEWAADPERQAFWTLALRLAQTEMPVAARIVPPAVAIDHARVPRDLRPLLAALDGGDARAPFLLTHLTGARTTLGAPARPLAGRDDLALWSDLARELGNRARGDIAYPLRLLVWGLHADYERLRDDERAALGVAARGLLQLAWAQPDPPAADVGVALEAVARTCSTDPSATRALLMRVADPERIPRFGSYELVRVADELGALAACVPDVVERLYAAAYAHDEDSKEQTAFGSSQILRLTSTKEQDWRMARYGIAQEYPRVLEADARTGVRVLSYACEHEASSNSYGRPDQEFTVSLDGAHATVRNDHSEWWDRRSHNRDVSAMLDSFEEKVAQAAAAGDSQMLSTVFDVLGERPQPAAVWRRVVRAAAREPGQLAQELAAPLASSAFLGAPELLEPVGALLPAAFEYLTNEERERVESAILALPSSYPDERREVGERRRDQLLGVLDEQLLQTPPARARAAQLAKTGTAPPPEQPFDVEASWREVAEEELYRERGIDPTSPANEQLLSLVAPVSEFARAHSNTAPGANAVAAAIPHIEVLRAWLKGSATEATQALVDEAEAWLCEAAAALAWQTPLPVGDESVALARDLAIQGSRAVRPDHTPQALEQFDSGLPSWGVPSGRIDAARALLLLCREPAAVNAEVLTRVSELARDPHPTVRWSVARWLGLARQADEAWTWSLVNYFAQNEPSAQVREALLHTIARFASDQLERAATTVSAMYEREATGDRRESLLRALAQTLFELWIWRGERRGRALVDDWAAEIERDAELARNVLVALRDPVTHGGDGEEHSAIRWRSIGAWADLSRAAGEAFHRYSERLRTGDVLSDDEQASLREIGQLLDTSASEMYFASGSYAEKTKSADERLGPDKRERFYREAAPVLDVLVSIGLPSIAHHVLETLAGFVEIDPRGVLLRIGSVLEAGRAWGYQLESLAEQEFVALVERYLASHRDLLMRDRAAREVLVRALESFVEAGWPSARRLMYGLDDMFR